MDELQPESTKKFKISYKHIICVVILALVGAFGVYAVTHAPREKRENLPESVQKANEKYIRARIDSLSRVKPAEGKKFDVVSIEHKDRGDTIVIYGDGVTTYTAKAVFQMTDKKSLDLLEFTILETNSSLK